MRKKVILVIDDDEMNLQIAKMILERKLPCEVLCADNGVEGIDLLKNKRVDLVLLDVMMPDFDGVETLQEIRADKQIKDVPIMMLTASSDIETIQKVGALGVKDYIKKPFMPADLVERINKKLAELAEREKILLLGDNEDTLQEMQTIIETNFNHTVSIAMSAEEISEAGRITLLIACADMKFIDGLKILALVAEEEKFQSVPFALTTPDSLRELLEKMKAPPEEKKPAKAPEPKPAKTSEPKPVEVIGKSAVVHADKKKLGNVVTSILGYKLDRKI